MKTFEMTPKGPFDLLTQNQIFGGFPINEGDPTAIIITFPVEGWRTSASVILRQNEEKIKGEVYGAEDEEEKAWKQAISILSLDIDGNAWPEIGRKDPIIGNLQKKYQLVRPTLFRSPYEAASAFIIGHRISIHQRQKIYESIAQEFGDRIQTANNIHSAFPRPHILKTIPGFKGLTSEKMKKLYSVADAAIDGLLNRKYLQSLPISEALMKLKELPGIGEFFAQGILIRGAGFADEITDDHLTKETIQLAYTLPQIPDQKKVLEIAENWQPYRMWAVVLLHIWVRRELKASYWKKPKK